ncbi:MAG TPA: bifunctional folylpolyglutamate synthase/dihydrofolate synthase [Candidatus Avanaerovorax faecigallinarum]|nr:bifunctional folylpolyglutamate synthase/dihydrofolate synthase [Candidatus Avanaerovorax faecigallinarum]
MGNTKAENIIHSMDKFRDPENLSRMRRLMEKLGNPQDNLRFVHIAGTNGKGSVSRFIYEILEASGYKTGIFTSPYIERFNERIEVDHNLISDSDLNRLTDKVMKAAEVLGRELEEAGKLEPGETPVTEFDMITAAAFLYFNEIKANPVVLEVGLGGRGDSTNVIRNPLACVITTIGMDHTDRLGNTLGEIAGEKSGIIKAGCTVISAVTGEEAKSVIMDKALELSAEFIDVSEIKTQITERSLAGTEFTVSGGKSYRIRMAGDHQVRNALTALSAVEAMNRTGAVKADEAAVRKGLAAAVQPGRMEVIRREGPVIVLDGAHNPEGAEALAKACGELFGGKRALIVTAMMKDKDIDGILSAFARAADGFIFTRTEDPRSEEPVTLAERAAAFGAGGETAGSAEEAVNKALEAADFDVIIFAGSLYLIGEVRHILREKGFLEEER